MTDIGIAAVGMYLPEGIVTAEEIAAESGLPEWVVRDKLGITEKRMALGNEQPNDMATWAIEDCLAQTDIKPDEIDVVLCNTEEWKEYLLWTAGIDLAHRIGAHRAWALDIHMRCCTNVSALKLARNMMTADPDINTVLIAGGYRVGDFVRFSDPDTSFLFNVGAGASAMLLRKGLHRNRVLASHMIVDGSMSRHVVPPASGTVRFPTDEAVQNGDFYLHLTDPPAMKGRLAEVSMPNWLTCIDEALRKSGYTRSDVDFLNMVLVKPSAYRAILEEVGLTEEQGVYNDRYGHIGEHDSIINIIEGIKQGRLHDGSLMLIVGAGTGYVWGASVVEWGPADRFSS
ncbi:MAG: 3-oxoacyl-ACP synthase [Chloroflexi bacterium]|nr:3-oxoacyl-ACP synthase [Chloroflexota bacterium]